MEPANIKLLSKQMQENMNINSEDYPDELWEAPERKVGSKISIFTLNPIEFFEYLLKQRKSTSKAERHRKSSLLSGTPISEKIRQASSISLEA